ncbi:MAG TPA: YdeI/OmpD-associated family protein [Vicinamibacterales bacterium]|nr:YdeI/OmpD-associated family protein [Vicinamibacterales bacterium]
MAQSLLANKLRLKPGMRVAVVGAPADVSLAARGVTVEKSLEKDLDLVLLFAKTQKQLQSQWARALASVKQDGAVWVSYPKKSSGIETDLGMGEWDATNGSDWNPVAMIGLDDTWSAVRFKYAPGLEQARHARQTEPIRDADGSVCVDRERRIVTPPQDLRSLLAKHAKARSAFDALSFTNRKEFVVWIVEAKKPETRAARLTKTVQMLAAGKKNPSAR